jgi:hypothetical protein
MLLIQTNKQTDRQKINSQYFVQAQTPGIVAGPSVQPRKTVLPRNNFQDYNTFWKRGEATDRQTDRQTDKQQGIWFV